MKTQHLLFCLFGIVTFTNVTYAEVNFGKKVPSADQVIDALSPAAATAPVNLRNQKPKPSPSKAITACLGIFWPGDAVNPKVMLTP